MNVSETCRHKVLIFHPALPPYRVDLFNALAVRHHLRLVLCSENLASQKFNQAALIKKMHAEHVFLTKGFTISKRIFRFGIKNEICKFNPDIVITMEFSPTTIVVAVWRMIFKGGFKHIVWTDDNPERVSLDNCFRRLARRYLLSHLDGIVFLSNESEDYYRIRYGWSKLSAIVPILQREESFRNGLFRANDVAIDFKNQFGLDGKRVLLFVGRLSREKRIDHLIGAFANLATQIKSVVLVLVGDGKERAALSQLAKELNIFEQVIFAGRHEGDSLAAWYLIGTVFALTSESEPFGAVVNEALLAGIPVVCSNKAGAKILIKDNENGSVVDPEDNSALQSALLYWLNRCSPVLSGNIRELRPSLMSISFRDGVEAFAKLIISVVSAGQKMGN